MDNQGGPLTSNRGNLGEREGNQPPLPIHPHNKAHIESQLGDALRVQSPASPRL